MVAEGETPWTIDSLKEHFEQRIADLEARLLERKAAHEESIAQVRLETDRALRDADKAVTKSEDAASKRFDAVNAFRGQLSDQVKTFLTRDTYDAFHTALTVRVDAAEKQIVALLAEKRGGKDTVTAVYSFAGFVSVLLVIGTILAANGVFK